MGIDEILKDKREAILELAAKYGMSNVRVFGSVARGEAGPDSDVDFLIDIVNPDLCKGLNYFGFAVDLEDLLGRRVDVAEPKNVHWYIRDRVLEEAIPL